MYRDRFAYYEAQPWVNAVALDETPPRLRRLSANAWAHHRGARVCYWCALAHTENVYANGRFVVVRSPVPRFAGRNIRDSEVSSDDATAFVDAFSAVQPRLGDDYNALFYSPLRAGVNPALHWHVTLAPRCKRPAGFELSTGLWVAEDEESGRRLVM